MANYSCRGGQIDILLALGYLNKGSCPVRYFSYNHSLSENILDKDFDLFPHLFSEKISSEKPHIESMFSSTGWEERLIYRMFTVSFAKCIRPYEPHFGDFTLQTKT